MNYSAPEQLRGVEADTRSDIYALGASLYYAFSGNELSGVLSRKNIPATLVPVIEKACQQMPGDRYQSMTEFRQAVISAGRLSIGGNYVKSHAICPHCSRENPEIYKHCRHCGGSLAELFRPCPKCEEEIRNDMAFCAYCGSNVALECLQNDIEQAVKEYDYEKQRDLNKTGVELFPGNKDFLSRLSIACKSIKKSQDLKEQLDSVGNDSEKTDVLKCLLELYPNTEEYVGGYRQLNEDLKQLKEEIEKYSSDCDYEKVQELCKTGISRFPLTHFFVETKQWSINKASVSNQIEAKLRYAENDSERIEALRELVELKPNEYTSQLERLENSCSNLQEEIDVAIKKYDFQKALDVSSAAFVKFPHVSYFSEQMDIAKKTLSQIETLYLSIEHAGNNSERIIILRKILEIDPNHKSCNDRLKLLLNKRGGLCKKITQAMLGDCGDAMEICKTAINQFPSYQPLIQLECELKKRYQVLEEFLVAQKNKIEIKSDTQAMHRLREALPFYRFIVKYKLKHSKIMSYKISIAYVIEISLLKENRDWMKDVELPKTTHKDTELSEILQLHKVPVTTPSEFEIASCVWQALKPKGETNCYCKNGKVQCSKCNGSGIITCYSCEGSGKSFEKIYDYDLNFEEVVDEIIDNGHENLTEEELKRRYGKERLIDVKQIKCDKCKGKGSWSCKKCNGTGSVKCTHCNGFGKLNVYQRAKVKWHPERTRFCIWGDGKVDHLMKMSWVVNRQEIDHFASWQKNNTSVKEKMHPAVFHKLSKKVEAYVASGTSKIVLESYRISAFPVVLYKLCSKSDRGRGYQVVLYPDYCLFKDGL